MAIRTIIKAGNPLLKMVASPVQDIKSPEVQNLIADMFETMEAASGAGLAAPQIAESQRIVIFSILNNPRYPFVKPVPTTVLINPKIEILSEDQDELWEGCLSLPGLRGLTPRYTHIRYSGYDQDGNFFEREVTDFHARVVQHECDHLDGILFPERMKDLSNLGFEDELKDVIRKYYEDKYKIQL